MIAFSTCWNSGRHTAGDEMLREIKGELGFSHIELGHGIRISLMPGIQKMFEKGEVTFSSLHNFCPLPVEVMQASPDCYKFSAGTMRERERAVKQTLQTIDFAERLGAPFVVLHCGEVPMNPITDELIALAKNGQLLSREYVRKKIAAVKKREERALWHLERVKECLKRIVEYAATKNIRLGVEGRRGYEEMPNERELPALLDELNSPPDELTALSRQCPPEMVDIPGPATALSRHAGEGPADDGRADRAAVVGSASACAGYWHDFGHIQIKENLGFLNHEEWLRLIGPRAFGCHVQDCIWPAQDHQPPFAGGVDLLKLVPLLPNDCQFVWEMSPRKTAEEIVRSVETWKKHFAE